MFFSLPRRGCSFSPLSKRSGETIAPRPGGSSNRRQKRSSASLVSPSRVRLSWSFGASLPRSLHQAPTGSSIAFVKTRYGSSLSGTVLRYPTNRRAHSSVGCVKAARTHLRSEARQGSRSPTHPRHRLCNAEKAIAGMIREEKSKCLPCRLFKLPVGYGTAKPGQVTGDPGGAVGREGRCERAKVEGSIQGSVQPQFSEVASRNRDASAP